MHWCLAVAMLSVLCGGLACDKGVRSDGEETATLRAGGYNTLLITLDTTRADFLGCYGAADAKTPNLNRLAKEGVRLTRCYTCVPLTLPSHASMFTGYYPFVHGLRNNGTRRLADSFDTLAEIFKSAGYATGAEVASAVMNARYGLDQGFDTYHDVMLTGHDVNFSQRRGDDICDAAIKQLEALAADKFFLWVHFYDPHDPYDPPGYVGPSGRPAYAAEITFMDAQIGRLIDALKRLKLERKTVVLLVGDHGEGLTEHGERTHGDFVYETTLHVPCILWCPGTIPGARTIDYITRTVDLFPTILELADLPRPAGIHGLSLVPGLKDARITLSDAAYAESLAGHLRLGLAPLRCMLADHYKYVLGPTRTLVDLHADPRETRNAIREYADIAAGLHGQMETLIREAPPPPTAGTAALSISDAERQVLGGLGYTTAGSGETIQREIDVFEPVGPDPRNHVEDLNLDSLALQTYAGKNFARAEELLRVIVSRFPNAPMPLVDLSNVVEGLGRLGESCDILARALSLQPENSDLRYVLVERLIRAERWAEAATHADLLLDEKPDDIGFLRNKGLILIGQGRPQEALAIFERAKALDSTDHRPIRGEAYILFRQELYPQAENLLRTALQADPDNPLLLADLGFALEKQDRLDDAMASYERAIRLNPGTTEARQGLARILVGQKRWADALEQCNHLIEQTPGDPSLLGLRAQVLSAMNRPAEAAADYEKLQQLDGAGVAALRGQTLALLQAGRHAEAIQRLQETTVPASDEPERLGLLAYATQLADRPQEAEEIYRDALNRAPDRADIRTWYGGMLMRQRRTDEAEAQFRQALETDPNELDARYNLGQILVGRGEYDDAVKHFEHILTINPKHVRACHAIGVAYAQQGRWSNAAAYFEKALAIDPSDRSARRDLDRVRQKMQEQPTP